MFNTYKFRGKSINNEENNKWIYGSHIIILGRHYIIPIDCMLDDFISYDSTDNIYLDKYFEVHPDSVGMWTGLVDKNGVEIFEKDIIEKMCRDKPYSEKARFCKVHMEVQFSQQKVSDNEHNNNALAKDPSVFNNQPCFFGKTIWNEKGYGCYSWSEFASCEVIGNTFDYKNLIK